MELKKENILLNFINYIELKWNSIEFNKILKVQISYIKVIR